MTKKKSGKKDGPKKPPRNKVPDDVTHQGTRNLLAYKAPAWKPGQSGNPDGKPPGPNRSTILKAILSIPMTKEQKDEALKKLGIDATGCNIEDFIDLKLVGLALDGDLKAIQEIKDTLHGKMAEVRKIGGDDDGVPLRVRRIIDDVPLDD